MSQSGFVGTGFFGTMYSRGALPVLERVVGFAEARHRHLVGNVANADTPAFRRRDLSDDAFTAELRKAIRRQEATGDAFAFDRDAGHRLESASPSALRLLGKAGRGAGEGILRHDGNNVDIEREMALLVRNAGRGQQAATLLKKLLAQVRAAVSERA